MLSHFFFTRKKSNYCEEISLNQLKFSQYGRHMPSVRFRERWIMRNKRIHSRTCRTKGSLQVNLYNKEAHMAEEYETEFRA